MNNYFRTFSIVLIALVISLKVYFLSTKGFFYFPDEYRYAASKTVLFELLNWEINEAVKSLYSIWARPASVIWFIIPNVFQLIGSIINNQHMYMPVNTIFLFFFNIIIQVFIFYYIYNIAKLFFKNNYIAFLSIIIYQSLDASFKYLQHALPYDLGLLIFLKVIYGLTAMIDLKPVRKSKLFFLGFWAMLGFNTYPGFITLYLFSILIFIHLYYLKIIDFKNIYVIGFGSMICMLIFEVGGLLYAKSYLYNLIGLSTQITQGSFEESLIFIFKYLMEVEGFRGFILIFGGIFSVGSILYWRKIDKSKNNMFHYFILYLLGIYVLYGINGYFLKNSVYYGRLVHQYIPFLSIAASAMLFQCFEKINCNQNSLKIYFSTFSILMTILFYFSIQQFNKYVYPRDILNSPQHIKTNGLIDYIHEIPIVYRVEKCRLYDDQEIDNKNKYTAVNAAYFSFDKGQIDRHNKFMNNNESVEIFNEKHIINYKGYQYEGSTIQERKTIDSLQLRLKIYLTDHF